MSQRKKVFILLLALLCIFAIVVSVKDEEKDERSVLADFDSSELKSISFISEEEWVLENSDRWSVRGSEKTSDTSVDALLSSLLSFKGKHIADKDVPKEVYGIDKSSLKVKFSLKDGSEQVFVLGSKTPPGTEYYIMAPNGSVYSVYSHIGNAFKTQKYQVLDSFVYGIEYGDIARIEVDGSPAFALINMQDKWIFESDGYKESISLEDIRSKVTRHFGGMYSLSVLDGTEKNIKDCGFDGSVDVETVTITNRQGAKDEISIGRKTEKGTYIRVNHGEEIYLVISDYFDFIKLFREVVL